MVNSVYELAKQRTPDGLEFVGIDLVVAPTFHPICVWRGVGYHTHAAQCSAQELLDDWREHLALCDAGWLVPLLERFAAGEPFNADIVLRAYQKRHGQPAPFRNANAP